MATLKHGFLEKESKGYITSKWSMRWCVLTADEIKFYGDQNLSVSKGSFPITSFTAITRRTDGSKKHQLVLHDPGTKNEVVLAASDSTTFTSWEEAISKVIHSQSKTSSLQGDRRSAVDNSAIRELYSERYVESFQEPPPIDIYGDLQAVFGDSVEIIRSGYLQKQGHIVQSWKKRWFVLTPNSLAYFSTDKMAELKGSVNLDQYSHVYQEKANTAERLFPLCLWTDGGVGSNRTALYMNASDEVSALQWETSINSVILRHKHVSHPIAVKVSVVSDLDAFPIVTLDQIYIVQLYIGDESVSKEFHHFSDIRDVQTNIRQVSSADVVFQSEFPRTYRRNSFGVALRVEEIEYRRLQLESWLQELLEKYHEFDYLTSLTISSVGNDIQTEISSLYGCSPSELCLHLDKFAKLSDSNDNSEEKPGTPNAICNDISSLVIENYNVPASTLSQAPSSALSKLFGSANSQGVENGARPTPTEKVEPEIKDGDADGDRASVSQPKVLMPEDPAQLKNFNFITLAELCKLKRIDCRNFKAKKHYVKALLETYYTHQLPFLHGKDARTELKRLSKLVEGKKGQVLDPQLVTDIDNIFIDLMRKLRVTESIIPTLNVEYSTLDKFSQFSKCISIWDKDGDFVPEDLNMLVSLNSDSTINIFLLLAIKHRISTSTAGNEWLNRFCVHHGITIFVSLMTQLLQQRPLPEVDAAILLVIIQAFRLILEKDCRDVLVETSGVFTAVVRSLNFEYKTLALEVIEFLSESILYGGGQVPWLVVSGFKDFGRSLNQKPFEVLVDAIKSGDINVQSGVINLVNSLMLYEPSLPEKLELRMLLLSVDLENVCRGFVREYQKLLLGTKPSEPTEPTPPQENNDPGSSETDELQFSVRTYNRRLRAGVRICDMDMDESLAEDGVTIIHPAIGVMEGYAIEISEKEEEEKMFTPAVQPTAARNRSASLMGFPSTTNNYLSVAPSVFGLSRFTRRLSAAAVPSNVKKHLIGPSNPSTEALRETVAARRLWYKLNPKEKELLWFTSVDDSRSPLENSNEGNPTVIGHMSLMVLKDIIDYSTLACRVNFHLQNCLTIITEDATGGNRYYHMNFESLETKHRWLVALTYVRKSVELLKSPFHLPVDLPLKSSVTLKLRKNFEKHISLFRTLCAEDSASIYTNVIKSFLSSAELDFDPIDLSDFLYYELKTHRNEGKFLTFMKEMTNYVATNYAPRPANEEDEYNGKKHPLAVKNSENPIPRPPPLPPLPEPKPKRKPGTKMKQLFWTKVKPVNVNNTVWMTLNEPELNWAFLDANYAATSARRGGIALKSRESISSNQTKKIQITLFDSRRTQNVAIASGKLKKTPEELFDLVVSLDPEDLTLEITDTILNLLIPTADEIAVLKAFICNGGDVNDLDFCGRLFNYLMEVEGLESRLSLQRIMLTWFDQADIIEDQLTTIRQSTDELRDIEALNSFQLILGAVLAIGNYLNGSTPRGQAHGYRLEILLKFKNVKETTVARRNLLHYLIEEMSRNYPQIPLFYSSWKCIWLATKVTKHSLEEMMIDLEMLLNKCLEEIEKAKSIENDRVRCALIDRLSSFITIASDKFKDLCTLFDLVDRSVESIKRYFGETVLGWGQEEDPWQTFFQLIVKFAEMYKLSILELEDWKKAEARMMKKTQNSDQQNQNNAKIQISQFKKETLKQIPVNEKQTKTQTSQNTHTGTDVMEVFKERMLIIRKRNSTNFDDSDSENEHSEW